MARPRQVSDQQILSAMRQAVLAHGPAVPLEQVATSLGVTAPALLRRFGTRQALLLEALRPPQHPEWLDVLERGPTDEPLAAQLTRILTLFADFMGEVIPCMSALRESGVRPLEFPPKREGPQIGIRAMQAWLAAARERGLVSVEETDSAAYALLGALQMRAFLSHLSDHRFSPGAQQQYVADLTALFVRVLTAPAPAPTAAPALPAGPPHR